MTSRPSAVDLLLRCLSARDEPAFSDQVGRYSPADWKDVTDMALYHGLGPLLFTRLKRIDARARVPADAWKRLRLAYLTGAGENARRHQRLRPVLGGLRNAGIRVIVLKGAYLAEAVYGDGALRPMGDVDLMVPRAELPRAHSVLLDMGGIQERSEDIEWCCRTVSHLPPVVIRDLPIEIHWTIIEPLGPVKVDAAGLWDRACPAGIAGIDVLALSPEDLLLHLCLHISCEHGLGVGLHSFYDVAETIHHFRDDMDWAQVVERAREWSATRCVGLTLFLVERMFGRGVPGEVIERLVPGGLDQSMLEMASEAVAAQILRPGRVTMSVRNMWGARSLGDRAKLFWNRVFLSREKMAEKYPRSRNARHLCFYYARRFRDVLGAHGTYVPRLMLSRDIRQRTSKMASVAEWLKSGKP